MMSDNYADAPKRAIQFFRTVSNEAASLNARILRHAERAGRTNKWLNPKEFDAMVSESASDIQVFAQRIEALLPSYTQDIALTTRGFETTVDSLDPSTEPGAQTLRGMKRETEAITRTAREVRPKITGLRHAFETIRNGDHDPRLTGASKAGIAVSDRLLDAFNELETFALRVAFATDQK